MRASLWRLAALAGFALLLSSCTLTSAKAPPGSSASPSGATSKTPGLITAPQTLIKPGTLTFLSDMSYPPQESVDPASKQPVGSDIDIANAIATRMGLTATIQQADQSQIIASLLAKKGDAVISALAISPELSRQVALVGYFQSGQSIMVRKGNPASITMLSDLCGKSVAVQVTTPEQSTLDQANGDVCKSMHITIRFFPTDTEAVFQLRQGKVDAAMDDSPVAANFVAQSPDTIELAGTPLRTGPEGIAVDPKNGDMLKAMQQAMLAIYEDGTYHRILVKWNLVDGEIPASQIILTPNPSAP
jgi:polar amino acid transport system substrate-binding protein